MMPRSNASIFFICLPLAQILTRGLPAGDHRLQEVPVELLDIGDQIDRRAIMRAGPPVEHRGHPSGRFALSPRAAETPDGVSEAKARLPLADPPDPQDG